MTLAATVVVCGVASPAASIRVDRALTGIVRVRWSIRAASTCACARTAAAATILTCGAVG